MPSRVAPHASDLASPKGRLGIIRDSGLWAWFKNQEIRVTHAAETFSL
jgi:hypothetical protein